MCSGCEAYGLKKHGLTISLILYSQTSDILRSVCRGGAKSHHFFRDHNFYMETKIL